MANICYFEGRVKGTPEAIEEFGKMMRWEDEFDKDGLGRIYSFEFIEALEEEYEDGEEVEIHSFCGDCAWSIASSLISTSGSRNLLTESERLSLTIDMYSSEPGCCFQEHYVIQNGNQICSECVDYEEVCIEDMSTDELAAYAGDMGVSINQLRNTAVNSYYTNGGFNKWEYEI